LTNVVLVTATVTTAESLVPWEAVATALTAPSWSAEGTLTSTATPICAPDAMAPTSAEACSGAPPLELAIANMTAAPSAATCASALRRIANAIVPVGPAATPTATTSIVGVGTGVNVAASVGVDTA
jgi:hypothetical protein